MKKIFYLLPLALLCLASCSDDDNEVTAPANYEFERNGTSTVSFSGQTTRIKMATELISAMKDNSRSQESLQEMYANETATGGDANPYADADLNASTKSVRGKTAASIDFFFSNTSESAQIKADFDSWIEGQVNEVFPAWNQAASEGIAGQIADGSTARYVNAKGLEYDQAVGKSLIGALMIDQMLNNYLSTAVLDAGSNIADNDAKTNADGKDYTNMEHKWDEAFGYLFGATDNYEDAISTIGNDDSFLNKYLGRVNDDPDFEGIAQTIFDALKLGRAAIVANNYTVRDQQADIVKENISKLIAIRAVYYLQQGKLTLSSNKGGAFHDLSEGFGFVYSLRFTRKPGSNESYFTKSEVDGFIELLTVANGFWDVEPATLDLISRNIAAKFDFTLEEAAE